jgi:hypothetical protein
MSITANIVEDKIVSAAEADVKRIRHNSGDEFRNQFETGEGDLDPASIDKFFKEADQTFIEQFAYDLNTGVQEHATMGEADAQNSAYWQRALPVLERFKEHQAKRGQGDFAKLEQVKNREINQQWSERKKSYHLPLFKGDTTLDSVDEKHRDRVMNTQFISEALELDFNTVNSSYEVYQAQLWSSYEMEGEPNAKALRGRIKQDLVKADDRQNFIGEIAREAQNFAIEGKPISWTRAQDTSFDHQLDRFGVSKPEAQRIFRTAAREHTKAFAKSGKLGMQLISALAKNQGVEVDIKDASETTEDNLDVLLGKIVMLPREEREKILYVASVNAERLGLSNESWGDGLLTSLDRGGADFMQDVTSKVQRIAHADATADVEDIEKMKREHIEKFGSMYGEDRGETKEERKAFYESRDNIQNAERSTRVRNWREFNQDVRSIRDIVKKVEATSQAGIVAKLEQGTYDAAYSVPRMAAMVLPYAGIAMNWASYSEANDAQLRRQYPEMDAKNRERISNFAAIPQAFIEKLQVKTLFKGAPRTSAFIEKLGANGAVASFLGRAVMATGKEYVQERLQDGMLPLTQEIASKLSDDIPDVKAEVWEEALKVYDERTFFAVLPLAILGAGGSTAMDKMGAESFRKHLSGEDTLMLSGLTKDEASMISGMNEKGSINAHKEYQKIIQGKSTDEKKAASEAAVADGALERLVESEIMENGTQAEKKAFQDTKEAMDGFKELEKKFKAEVKTNEDGSSEVIFPEIYNKPNERFESEEAAVQALGNAEEEFHVTQSEQIRTKEANIEELQTHGIKTNEDAVKAVADHLGDAHEGSETMIVDSAMTLEKAIKQGQTTIENAMERIAIAKRELGVDMTLQSARILGSNKLKANAKGYINRIYKGANVATVFEESAEGYLKMAIEDGLSYDFFAGHIAEYQRATGEILVSDIDNISEQEVIEGFSKLARAHVYNERESSSFPPAIRAVLDAFKQFFDSVLETAGNLLQLKQDGKLDGDFEAHLNKAVGLDEQQIMHNQQKRYEAEIMEEMLDPEMELSNVMKGKIPRPSVLKENETLRGEVQRLWDTMVKTDRKGRKHAGGASLYFAGKYSGITLHNSLEYANEAGFRFETEAELLDAVESSMNGESQYPTMAAFEDLADGVSYNIGNENESSSFSISDGNNLVAVHNLSEDNLLFAQREFGAIPPPSIAVVRTDISDFDSFGEISLLTPPSRVDPSMDRNNKMWNADAYTPRFPSFTYEKDEKVANDIWNKYKDYSVAIGGSKYGVIPQGFEQYGVKELEQSALFQYAYLKEIGKAPRVVKEKRNGAPAALAKYAKGKTSYELEKDPDFEALVKVELEKEISEIRESFQERRRDMYFNEDGSIHYRTMVRMSTEAAEYHKKLGIDERGTKQVINKRIESHKKKFKAWVAENFSDLEKRKVIPNGYTNGGNRKYLPFNLDNVVKAMTKDVKAGEGFNYGVGSIRAAASKEFKNLKQIKADRHKIVSKKDLESFKETASKEFDELADSLRPYYNYDKNSFQYLGQVSESLVDLAKGKWGDWREAFSDVPSELQGQVSTYLNKLKHAPTEYFEAKIKEAVPLSDFTTALVPKTASKEVKQLLKSKGVKVRIYDSSVEGDRKKMIETEAKRSNVSFSIAPDGAYEEGGWWYHSTDNDLIGGKLERYAGGTDSDMGGIFLSDDSPEGKRYSSGYGQNMYRVNVGLNNDEVFNLGNAKHRERVKRIELDDAMGVDFLREARDSEREGTLDWTAIDPDLLEAAGFKGAILYERPAGMYGENAVRSLVVFKSDSLSELDRLPEKEAAQIKQDRVDNVDESFESYSITPAQDASYMKAVESGDVEAQQAMVDEAAKAAGYDSPKVYHGTDARFTVYDKDKTGSNFGLDKHGFFFTTDKESANMSRGNFPDGNPRGFTVDQKRAAEGGFVMSSYLKLGKTIKPNDVEGWENFSGSSAINTYDGNRERVEHTAIKNKADSFTLKKEGSQMFSIYNPNNIKSADPVTYDDNGKVIPLSERFNEDLDDIRSSDKSQSLETQKQSIFSKMEQALEDGKLLSWEPLDELLKSTIK